MMKKQSTYLNVLKLYE